MKNIGKVIKIVRHANVMTLDEAAISSGVSRIYINELERGKKVNISQEYLAKLASGYNLQMVQIVELQKYYQNLNVEEERRVRLTLLKSLQMIEENLYPQVTN